MIWDKERERIVHLYTVRGLSLREIAHLYDVSHSTICKYLARWGVKRKAGKNRRLKNLKGMTGQQFGHLCVIKQDTSKYPTHWFCRCICGKRTSVSRDKLIRGLKKSCGCKRHEKSNI